MTIFHFALPSPMTDAFAKLRTGRVLQYHNVTPASFFAPSILRSFVWPRWHARNWQRSSAASISRSGVSDYNRHELRPVGFKPTGAFPWPSTRRGSPAARRGPALEQLLTTRSSLSCSWADRAEQENRGSYPSGRTLQTLCGCLLPIHLRRPSRCAAVYSMIRGLMTESRGAARSLHLHRPGLGRGARRLLLSAAMFPLLSANTKAFAPRWRRWRPPFRCWPHAAAAVPRPSAEAACVRPERSGYAAELAGALVNDDLRRSVIAGQRRRLADFGDARIMRGSGGADVLLRGTLPPGARDATPMRFPDVVTREDRHRHPARYGTWKCLGGSEQLCRLVAERLSVTARCRSVDNLRARLRVTWRNE